MLPGLNDLLSFITVMTYPGGTPGIVAAEPCNITVHIIWSFSQRFKYVWAELCARLPEWKMRLLGWCGVCLSVMMVLACIWK